MGAQLQTTSSAVLLVCISGPDQGKRLAVMPLETTVGRDTDCQLLSDDADVAARHAVFVLDDGKVAFRAIAPALVFLDGQAVPEGRIGPGQQVRLGRSFWQLAGSVDETGPHGWISRLSDQITSAAGLEKVRGFSVAETFSEVFKKRAADEIEDYLIIGTRTTTPELATVDANWPKPWLFFKAFLLTAVAYGLFVFGWNQFHNLNLIPGLIMIGSMAVPLTLLIFFFEVNVTRNISLYQVLKLMLIGGVLSLIVSLFGFELTNLSRTLGPPAAGIIEEIGKAAALLLVINQLRSTACSSGRRSAPASRCSSRRATPSAWGC